MSDTVSILDGSTFVVSDRRGDLEATPTENHGLFIDDTRFLSRFVLTVNGIRPKLLSVDDLAYYKIQFFLALATGAIYVDSRVSIDRRREVNGGFHEEIVIVNHDNKPVDLEVRLDVDVDFADLFEVKDKLEKSGALYRRVDEGRLVFGYRRDNFERETWVSSTSAAEPQDRALAFHLHLAAKERWTTRIDVAAVEDPRHRLRHLPGRPDDVPRETVEANVAAWMAAAPRLVCSWEPLEHTYRRSLMDLAALRFRTAWAYLPAAGLPWFMTIFGRDSLITSFQALPFAPELARSTLKTLALLQGLVDDPFRDEEPGKILHELRLGELTGFADRPHSPYFGASDSTPLFLILLEEYERWTGDTDFVKKLEREARAAIGWIDDYGDRDGDGYVEYERRNPETGLENQCWKDSWDAIAFADGTLAPTPRATCEIQGYVYDAKIRTARLARRLWNDPAWAERLEREAAELKRRFNEDFWVESRGFFALALDRHKRKVDSLTSNIGHLLWSGIAEPDKAERCVQHLMGEALYSGWGVRTMANTEGSYNPLGYHVGTVRPHDTSMIAWGLRCSGHKKEAARMARDMLEASSLFHHRLPEAFAGYDRALTHYPVEYPTACSPQAWATAAPLLMVRALLGLDSDGEHLIVDPALPEPLHRLELLDIPGRWGRTDAFGRARIKLS